MSGSEIIEKAGVSTECFSDAVKKTVKDVNRTMKVSWFQVLDQRGRVTT